MAKRAGNIIWGILLVTCGLFWLSSVLFGWKITLFSGWWALLIIVPSVVNMVTVGLRLGNSLVAMIGFGLLIEELRLFPDVNIYGVMVALVLLLVGVRMLFHTGSAFDKFMTAGITEEKNRLSRLGIFGQAEIRNLSPDWKGGWAAAVLGSSEIDLSRAVMNSDAALRATAVLGGLTVYAPKGTRVELKRVRVLGKCFSKASVVGGEGIHTLYISGVSVLGVIEIAPPRI